MGHFTNDIVYARLAPGVFDELKSRTIPERNAAQHAFPVVHTGIRTPEAERASGRCHGAMALMRAAPNWASFQRNLQRAFPKLRDQLEMDV